MSHDLEPTEDFQARVLEGRTLAESGEVERAEKFFRALLDEARDGHPGNHASALSSLVTLYGRVGRYLEAHLLARRLAAMAQAHGPEANRTLAFAYAKICGALGKLHLQEPLERALQTLRATLDGQVEPLPNMELEYLSAAGTHAELVGDIQGARKHVDAYQAVLDAAAEAPSLYRWAQVMAEARVLLLEGRPQNAYRRMEELRSGELTPPYHRFKEWVQWVAIHTALGRREDARRLAAEAIKRLEDIEREPFLASGRIHRGTLLARDLENLGELDLAQRVHDLVAAAVIIRLAQVDECMQALPELGLADAASTAELSGFRKQFMREQHALLQRVAAILESRGHEYVRELLADSRLSDMIAICAWCESVRPADGRWLPIGHFIPRDSVLQVTHGICPPCADRWMSATA